MKDGQAMTTSVKPVQKHGVIPHDARKTMSGIEILRAMIAGKVPTPPITEVVGFELTTVEPGFAVFSGKPGAHLYNPYGTVHGGYTATLLDSAMTCAVQSLVPLGFGVTTLEFKISFVRAFTDTTRIVRAEGRAINVGRRVGVAEGKLIDDEGRILAHGTTTCLVFEASDGPGAPPKP
jgi:uncharacterized protein (TIGR00369 family)